MGRYWCFSAMETGMVLLDLWNVGFYEFVLFVSYSMSNMGFSFDQNFYKIVLHFLIRNCDTQLAKN